MRLNRTSDYRTGWNRHQYLVLAFWLRVLMLLSSSEVVNASSAYYYEQISLRHGLSQASVKCVLRDQMGLLWMGTKNGLNRFDGNEMKVYYHDGDDPTSIPDNNIHFIVEDQMLNLWVGTGKGLVKYRNYSDTFEQVYPLEAISESVYSNALLHGSHVLFGSGSHLAIYNLHSRQFRILPFQGAETGIPLAYSMIPWHGNTILIASRWKGLYICDLGTGQLVKASFFEDEAISYAFMDSFKRLWLGVYQQGVYQLNYKGEQLAHYHTGNSPLTSDIVLTINEIEEGVWFGTDGGGINILHPESGRFSFIQNIPEDRSSIPVNSILTIYKDHLSGVWAGTLRGGLFGIQQVGIRSYGEASLGSNYGLSNPTVLSLCEDAGGELWIGTDGGGLNLLHSDKEQFRHYSVTHRLKVNAVTRITKEELLINSFGQGLKRFKPAEGELRPFNPVFEGEEMPGAGTVGISLRTWSDQHIFLFDDRVHLFNVQTNHLETLDLENILRGEGELKVAGLHDKNYFLYGVKGFYEFNPETLRLSLVYAVDGEEVGEVQSAGMDGDGVVWFGSSEGLFWFTLKSPSVVKVESGLFRSVSSVAAGDNGRIWFGSGGSLFCYYVREGFARSYGRSDGVIPNEYLPKPVLKASNGDVYMGGVTGLVRLGHEMLLPSRSVGKPHVLEIREDGMMLNTNRYDLFKQTKQVVLPADYKTFQVRLFVKDENFFNRKYIRYKIEGYSKEFLETSEMNIDMSSLPHGRFSLLVMTQTEEGTWSEPWEVLNIRVLPPWWRTWWFLSLLVLVFAGMLVLLKFSSYRRAVKRMELEIAKKENALSAQKIQFMVNLSHELRTPLSLIAGPLERILGRKITSEEEERGLLKLMNRHVGYLRHLIDQVLDMQRMDNSETRLVLVTKHWNDWLKQVVKEFESEFSEAGISLVFQLEDQLGEVEFDTDKCRKVIYNILMNALKYAGNSKSVIVSSLKKADGIMTVSIQDQGPGFSQDKLGRVFERFFTDDASRGGTGVGLAYSKMLVELHGGRIFAINSDAGGAVVGFELPLQQRKAEKSGKATPGEKILMSSDQTTEAEVLIDESTAQELLLEDKVVLLVEDDNQLLKFIKESLTGSFRKVLTATNGRLAIEVIKKEFPDVIISDVMMPEMNGWELCRQVKSDIEISHIPFILLTARGNEVDSSLGYKLGADNYLAKPVSIELLLSVVHNLMLSRQQLRAHYRQRKDILQPAEITFSNADEVFLTKLNAIIEKEIENPALNVDFLAEQMAMSRAKLYAKFKTLLDTGINSYINEYRIKCAMKLLEQTDLPIVDISNQLGFMSQSYFSTLFKQYCGVSPNKYRQSITSR